jgi:hypothetical protein
LNWHVLRTILDHQVNLLIKSKGSFGDLNTLAQPQFNLNDFYIILEFPKGLTASEETFIKILLQNIIARQHPVAREVVLSDGQKMEDLTVDATQYQYETDTLLPGASMVGGGSVDAEFVVWPHENGLTIANSLDFLATFTEEAAPRKFNCGNQSAENLFLSSSLLNFIPWLQDFKQAVISYSTAGLNVCLR